MNQQRIALITGANGLIGSEAVETFIKKGYLVLGVDNNMRKSFFGEEASTEAQRQSLEDRFGSSYLHHALDIRDESGLEKIFRTYPIDVIIHAAAQPSHDYAGLHPKEDFAINASATVLLLELFRKYHSSAVFIFTSSSKVYGEFPNQLPVIETESRYDLPKKHPLYEGIHEQVPIDQTMHSIYGATKTAADIMVQEYGRYYKLKTGVFRGNCMTGSKHSGTMLHGFLSYLVKRIGSGQPYTAIGYRGKQVRDNIHSFDFVQALYAYAQDPRYGEVYNVGGGRQNSISILEAVRITEQLAHTKANLSIQITPRKGDHIWYISDNRKFRSHFPMWQVTRDIPAIISDILNSGRNG